MGRGRLTTCGYVDKQGLTSMLRKKYEEFLWMLLLSLALPPLCRAEIKIANSTRTIPDT